MAPPKVCTPQLLSWRYQEPYTYSQTVLAPRIHTIQVTLSGERWGRLSPYLSHAWGNVFLHSCCIFARFPGPQGPQARLTWCQRLSPAHRRLICFQGMSKSRPRLPCPFLSLWPVLQGKAKQACVLLLWVQNCKAKTSWMAPEMHTFNSVGPTAQPLMLPCPLRTNPFLRPWVTEQKSLKSSPKGTVCTRTAHHCLSSPASGPFYSTINTGWRRNR